MLFFLLWCRGSGGGEGGKEGRGSNDEWFEMLLGVGEKEEWPRRRGRGRGDVVGDRFSPPHLRITTKGGPQRIP